MVLAYIHNLDGRSELTKLYFSDIESNVLDKTKETVEKRLGIPVENQVYYSEQKNSLVKWNGYLNWPGATNLRLGYQPGIEKDEATHFVECKECTKINGKYAVVKTYHRPSGTKIGSFPLKLASTYSDLKFYLEGKLNVPVDLIVVLDFEIKRQIKLYQQLDETENILSSIFSKNCLPQKNCVYLLIKDSPRFIPNELTNKIPKTKPIYIYTEHGSQEVTKLLTITPEKNIFTVLQIKKKIQEEIGISVDSQIIYRNVRSCKLNDENTISCNLVDKTLGESLFSDFFDSTENEIKLYLTVDCGDDKNLLEICRQKGIKHLEIEIVSNDFITHCQVQPKQTFSSLKKMLKNNYQLSRKNQILYSKYFHILTDEQNLWEFFGCQLVNRRCKIFLLMEKTIPSSTICHQLGILQVTPEIPIKSLDGKTLLIVDLNDLPFDKGKKSFWPVLTVQLPNRLNVPSDNIVVAFEGETIANCKESKIIDIRELFFYNGIVREDIMLTVTFQPTIVAAILKTYDEVEIPRLKTLKIKFLTNQLEIDLRNVALKNVLDVKKYVSNEKKVPIGVIDVFFDGNILSNKEELVCFFVKSYIDSTGLDVNVVFQTAKDIDVYLKCPYSERFKVPVKDFVISRSKTIQDLKEKISDLTEVELSQLNITCNEASDYKDGSVLFIDDIAQERRLNSISVTIFKTVTLNLVSNSGFTDTLINDILHDDETIGELLERTGLNSSFHLRKSSKVSKETMLFDLKQDDIIELKGKNENPCKLM